MSQSDRGTGAEGARVVLFANTDWYLYNFRLPLALALRQRGYDVVMVAPNGPYAHRFASHGLRFVPFSFERLSLNPIKQASAVLRLARLYRRERPQLVHHFTIKCAVYGSLAARVAGRPAVVNALTGLGTVFSQTTRAYTRSLVADTLRIALAGTHVIVQNPEDGQQLVSHRLAQSSQIHLIRGSGVNLERFNSRRETNADGAMRVLLASRLIRSKGIAVFEAAAAEIRNGMAVDFLIAGAPDPGNPDTLTPLEIEQLAARGHVVMLGHVDDVAELLSSVDLVVLPTTYGEGVPRILIEAAAAGLPLVATDAPGCREIVQHGVNGLLFDTKAPGSLTAAIRTLLGDPPARQRMGASSRILAREFSEARVIAETLQTYSSAWADRTFGERENGSHG